MKKNLHGFTLAEVLVCVAIVGITAALVLPGLVSNVSSNVNVGGVARSVELIQNGMANIIQLAQNRSDEDIAPSNLAAIEVQDVLENEDGGFITDDDNLFALTMGIMGTEEAENYTINNIRDYSGNALGNGMLTDTSAYRFKKGNSVIIFQNVPNAGIGEAEDDEVITRIYIDANGNAAPNRIGRDVFLFGLTNIGHLVPAGSEAYNNNIFDENITLYQDTDAGCMQDITNGYACAARIMADKWNIEY